MKNKTPKRCKKSELVSVSKFISISWKLILFIVAILSYKNIELNSPSIIYWSRNSH